LILINRTSASVLLAALSADFGMTPGGQVPRMLITSRSNFVVQQPQGPDSDPIFEEEMIDGDWLEGLLFC